MNDNKFRFGLLSGMFAGGIPASLQGVILAGAQFDEPTLGFKASLGMLVGGAVGMIVGGMLARMIIDSVGASLVGILGIVGFIIGLAVGMAIGPPFHLPDRMPSRATLGLVVDGCLGWFGGCILAQITGAFRRR